MAQTVKVSTDLAALDRKLRERIDRLPRAAAAGINRVGSQALTLAVREIQKDTGASAQKAIRANLKFKRATATKPVAELVGISAKKDRIPIYQLRPSPRNVTKRKPAGGVRYGKAGKLLPGSFIARLKSGHIGVFKRSGKARLPIQELFGPSVALVFSRARILDPVKALVKTKLPAEIARAYKFGEFADG